MKRILLLAATALTAVAVVPVATADNDPFPSTKTAPVFVAAQTVNNTGAMQNQFAPGSTVIFRAYALDSKSRKAIAPSAMRYFYVSIPNQPTVKLTYGPTATGASGIFGWTGAWTVPATYPAGTVPFKILARTKRNARGFFVQMPVASAMLTISAKPQTSPGNPPAPQSGSGSAVADLGLYVDTVNGTRPAAAAPRPVGCTQTNVYKRGEQLVLRAWGYDLSTGELLSNDNVEEAHFAVAGQPNVTLNWGAHGTAPNRVFFWANAWNIPASYPLGDATLTVSYKLTSGKTGTLAYPITIIP